MKTKGHSFRNKGKVNCIKFNEETLSGIADYIFRHSINNFLGNKVEYGVK